MYEIDGRHSREIVVVNSETLEQIMGFEYDITCEDKHRKIEAAIKFRDALNKAEVFDTLKVIAVEYDRTGVNVCVTDFKEETVMNRLITGRAKQLIAATKYLLKQNDEPGRTKILIDAPIWFLERLVEDDECGCDCGCE